MAICILAAEPRHVVDVLELFSCARSISRSGTSRLIWTGPAPPTVAFARCVRETIAWGASSKAELLGTA
jgi:hypothetical protein